MVPPPPAHVTVAVLAHNRRDPLRETLRHTLADAGAGELDVIVVDNASTDGTAAMLAAEFPTVQVIRLAENVGASGWNAALAAGRGDWFLLLDDDCHLEAGDLSRALAAAAEHDADLVSFRVRSGLDPDFHFDAEYPTGLLSYWGCAALLSRRAVERLGGYDPNIFIWANELELTLRLLDAGLRHLALPEVVAVHMKAPTPPRGQGEFQAWAYATGQRNLAYVAARALQPRDLPPVLGHRILRVLIDGRVLDRRALAALPAVARGTLAGLRARRPVRAELSTLYRRNFPDFGSPLIFVRGPLDRWRARGDPERAERDRQAREARVYAARRRYFPREAAVLAL